MKVHVRPQFSVPAATANGSEKCGFFPDDKNNTFKATFSCSIKKSEPVNSLLFMGMNLQRLLSLGSPFAPPLAKLVVGGGCFVFRF